MRLGYRNVRQFPWGYQGWQALTDPGKHNARGPTGPVEGDLFPECRLVVLQTEKDVPYLGLSPESRYFSLSDISGDYLLVVVYNEMCMLCLAELPRINRLFELADADGSLKERIKMLGLGAGSTKRAVARFRKEKGFDLPLFADEKWTIFGLLGKPTLPVIYLLKKDKDKGLRIMWRHEGAIGNPEEFLAHLKSYLKLDGDAAR